MPVFKSLGIGFSRRVFSVDEGQICCLLQDAAALQLTLVLNIMRDEPPCRLRTWGLTVSKKEVVMGDLFLLSERQMARISPHFPLPHGMPRVDTCRVVSGIVYVIRNGLQWKDAPPGCGPHKTQDALQPFHPLEPVRCVRPDLCGVGRERSKG